MLTTTHNAAAFAEHDPGNAEIYLANAEDYKDRLRTTLGPLKAKIQQIPENKRWLLP